MEVYIVLAVISVFLLLIRNSVFYKDKILRSITLTLVYLYMFVIYIFRAPTVGTDYPMYYYFFRSPAYILQQNYIEKGYIYLNSFVQNLGNFVLISVFAAIIIFCGVLFLFHVTNINSFTGTSFFILSYMYLIQFNVLRASIANGIIMIGFAILIKSEEKIKNINVFYFLVILLIATNFHTTSFYALIFLLLYKINITPAKVLVAFGIFLFSNLIYNLYNFISIIALWIFPSYVSKYGSSYGQASTDFSLVTVANAVMFLFVYLFCKYNDDNDYKINIILAGTLCSLITYNSGDIVNRLGIFTNIFIVLFSSIFLDKGLKNSRFSSQFKYIIRITFIIFWILVFFARLYANNAGVVPYSFGI